MSKCTFCGKEFQQEHGNQIYCSERCRQDQRNMLKRIRRANEEKIYNPIRSHSGIKTIEYIQNRVNTKSSKMIYLGGYTNDQGKIYIMCSDCGNVFSRSTRILRPSSQKTIQCDYCNNILSLVKEHERQEEARENKELKRIEKLQRRKEQEAERQAERQRALTKVCAQCGMVFKANNMRIIYCSDVCRNRAQNSKHETKRRLREKYNGEICDNISLELLYKRDKGKCWICRRKCDWTDIIVRDNGVYVAGDSYPSRDHVIPLAKGGSHTWDNIRLAHRGCNRDKRDRLMIENENSQMIFVF